MNFKIMLLNNSYLVETLRTMIKDHVLLYQMHTMTWSGVFNMLLLFWVKHDEYDNL